jgi:hypothetical protein
MPSTIPTASPVATIQRPVSVGTAAGGAGLEIDRVVDDIADTSWCDLGIAIMAGHDSPDRPPDYVISIGAAT